jgi:hypothetical protein
MMKRMMWMALIAGAGAWVGSAHAFVITPFYPDAASWTPDEQTVVQQAITDWTSSLRLDGTNKQNITIVFAFSNAGNAQGDYLAEWVGSLVDPANAQTPYSGGVLHTIYVNADFQSQDSWSLATPVPGAGLYDMLTVIRHELGHALGFAPGYYTLNGVDRWLSHVSNGVFDPGGLNVPMDATYAHVNIIGDLMYPVLERDTREDITQTDLAMLSLAYGFSAAPEPGTLGMLAVAAAGLTWRRRQARHL